MSTELERAIRRVVEGTRHWSPARWSSRAEAMHALVQALADLTADAEGRPRRAVPRLPSDLHLPDQLQVIALDLARVELTEARYAAAEAAIRTARDALF
ncbi:hypothetical protein [Glycomyces niveus]|uniref:UVR domain-containing protein n=1 Tax=Glycomyces niveus TaxID=2820287 RepID=A0ABS3U7V9_9ACTN|nr:hypothetical protein [Glycomyces sp. NEAU-S30]MBO3733787.1 hypothetical protein [Glycomyces sp. NEAU-S30]